MIQLDRINHLFGCLHLREVSLEVQKGKFVYHHRVIRRGQVHPAALDQPPRDDRQLDDLH